MSKKYVEVGGGEEHEIKISAMFLDECLFIDTGELQIKMELKRTKVKGEI